jgi:alpha-amylase
VVKKEPAAKKSATKKTAESKKAVGRAKKTVTKKEE